MCLQFLRLLKSPSSFLAHAFLTLDSMYISYKNLWWDNFILYYNFKGAELLIVGTIISRARRNISQQKFNNSIASLGVSKSPT